MQVNITEGGSKIQLLYVLWVLENFSDEKHTLKQDDIVKILADRGYSAERKSVKRDLKLLLDFGYNIHGVEPELDEDGNELPMRRGAIWLEREISDEKLKLLMDSILFSNYIGKNEAKELIEALISLGSGKLKKKSATSIIDGGRIYHQDNANFFKELAVINEAMSEKDGEKKQVSFKYAQYRYKVKDIVLEKEKSHIVSPYFFVSKKGNYYLVGYNHKEERLWHYRMDYVKDVQILKTKAKDREETILNGKDIGKYVSEHPYMFSGTPEGIIVKVDSDRLGIIVDTFGSSFEVVSSDSDYATVKIYCSELDAFHWAIQYGGHLEVLAPQKLRNQIRDHVEGMAIKYSHGEGDRYDAAMFDAKRKFPSWVDLNGIDLSERTKHHGLTDVRVLLLSDNNLKDVSFMKSFNRMFHLVLKNNPVEDLSVLGELPRLRRLWLRNLPNVKNLDFLKTSKSICCLRLDLQAGVDCSALNDYVGLEELKISSECAYKININTDKIRENNPKVQIEIDESDFEKRIREENSKNDLHEKNYPYNLLNSIIGRNATVDMKEKDIVEALEEMFKKISKEEVCVIKLIYQEELSNYAVSKKLSISEDAVERLKESAISALSHPSFQKPLERYIKTL